ncbi:MAG: GNAT family N-acetyltransferase [Veillonella sp.]|nr:GNAT family N-acetyltransferase [Veillonella sp.]
MEEFKLLVPEDAAVYQKLLVEGYAPTKQFAVSFAAADFTLEESEEWIRDYPTYGLFVDGELVSSMSLCLPWCEKGTPTKYPLIGHVVTSPAHKGKGYARKTMTLLEDKLRKVYRTPKVTLGTAAEHPWLPKMYESWGYKEFYREKMEGKIHTTIFYEKEL